MFKVSIEETENVIRAIHERYGFDISAYAMSSLRLRMGRILRDYSLPHTDMLTSRILEDSGFFDRFVAEISVGSPDLFRDPDLWIELRDRIMPELLKENKDFEILVPSSVNGDELYSICILLAESGWSRQVRVTTTCLNSKIIENIREGLISHIRYKTSLDNYGIFNPANDPELYFRHINGKIYRSKEFIEQVSFQVKKPTALSISGRVKLILFRNRLLYMNQAMKNRILNSIAGKMKKGTYLVLGIRESLMGTDLEKVLYPVSRELNIRFKSRDE